MFIYGKGIFTYMDNKDGYFFGGEGGIGVL